VAAPPAATQSPSWVESLERVSADLELLNQNTEHDFLKIGGELSQFMDAVNSISSELTALANAMSGEQGRGASEALTAALDRSREMQEQSEDGKGELKAMRRTADQLRGTLTAFQNTILNFHVLGVLTQIETARLGTASSDFGDLADGIKLLTGDVQNKVQHALDTAATLIVPVESALRDIRLLEQGRSKDLSSMILEVEAGLASFREIQERARESVLRLRVQSDAISGAFMKVVVSIQFHDITRQQVEHVIETLKRLSETPDNQRSSAAVLMLQSSQLAAAAEKFSLSVESVAGNLENVAAHVLEMVEEGQTLSSSATVDKDSFLSPIEKGCSAILDNLILCGETEAAARVISGHLSEPIGRMRESIEAIQSIEIQMQRLALNANIRAVHIGVAADALGVLSGNMQRLAMDSAQRSDGLLEGLGSMQAAADRLTIDSSGGEDACLEGLRAAVAGLHSSSEAGSIQADRIVECGTRLREGLATTRENFSIGAQFSEAVRRARATLEEIGETSEPGSLEDQAASLAKFAANYTMQSERDLYESATQAESVPKEDDAAVEDFELF
jgi:hypothetical protein